MAILKVIFSWYPQICIIIINYYTCHLPLDIKEITLDPGEWGVAVTANVYFLSVFGS